jgi:aquaporin Z
MHRHDLLGYIAAQFLGAGCGAVLALAANRAALQAIHYDVTAPGTGVTVWGALLTEFFATAALIALILCFVSFRRTARLTPFAVWLLVATLVWQTAQISGTSLNPARSFGSALLAWLWQGQWIYFVAPTLAGVVVALGYRWIVGPHHIVTAKLFHPLTDLVICHFPHCALCPAVSTDAGSCPAVSTGAGSSLWLRSSQWLRSIGLSRQGHGYEG